MNRWVRLGWVGALVLVPLTQANATEIKLQHIDGLTTVVQDNGPGDTWTITDYFPDGTTNTVGSEPATQTGDEIIRALIKKGDSVTVNGSPFIPGVN